MWNSDWKEYSIRFLNSALSVSSIQYCFRKSKIIFILDPLYGTQGSFSLDGVFFLSLVIQNSTIMSLAMGLFPPVTPNTHLAFQCEHSSPLVLRNLFTFFFLDNFLHSIFSILSFSNSYQLAVVTWYRSSNFLLFSLLYIFVLLSKSFFFSFSNPSIGSFLSFCFQEFSKILFWSFVEGTCPYFLDAFLSSLRKLIIRFF